MGRERGDGGQQISQWGARGARAWARCPQTRAAGGTALTGGVSVPEHRCSRCRGHQELPTKVTRRGKDKTHPKGGRRKVGHQQVSVLRFHWLLRVSTWRWRQIPQVRGQPHRTASDCHSDANCSSSSSGHPQTPSDLATNWRLP